MCIRDSYCGSLQCFEQLSLVRTLLAVETVEAGCTVTVVSVHVGVTEAAVQTDRRLDGARVIAVVDVAASHCVINQIQLTTVDRHLLATVTNQPTTAAERALSAVIRFKTAKRGQHITGL